MLIISCEKEETNSLEATQWEVVSLKNDSDSLLQFPSSDTTYLLEFVDASKYIFMIGSNKSSGEFVVGNSKDIQFGGVITLVA